jgi:hypothetical protein
VEDYAILPEGPVSPASCLRVSLAGDVEYSEIACCGCDMGAEFVAAHSCGEARELLRCGTRIGMDAWRTGGVCRRDSPCRNHGRSVGVVNWFILGV